MDDHETFVAEIRSTAVIETGAFSTLPLGKPMEYIFRFLNLEDIRNVRLVCRGWNVAFTEFLTFSVKLSDMTILPFLRIRRSDSMSPKLYVTKIMATDLSILSAPFTGAVLQEQLECPERVKVLVFQEGVSSPVKQNFLHAFRWIESLKFEKTPVAGFPEDLVLQNLTHLEMCPGAYNESDELLKFFRKIFFPSLKEASIQIHCRSDYRLYAGAHFFVAKHHRTLQRLKLMFLESLTLLSCFDMDAYANDIHKVLTHQRRQIENDDDYESFLVHASLLQLDVLSLWLIDNEELLTLSLKLIERQKCLTTLDVNHAYGYRSIQSNFGMVLGNNAGTLTKVTIPRLLEFDCSFLKNCHQLQEFALGMEFHFYDFENYGSIVNVQEFPTSISIQSVSIGCPMSKDDIYWMLSHVPAKTFLFIGLQGDEYSLKDAKSMIEAGPEDKVALMMCIPMSHSVFKHFEAWLNRKSDIGIKVIYHCKPTETNPGTAHFSLCFGLQSQRSNQFQCNYTPSDFHLTPS